MKNIELFEWEQGAKESTFSKSELRQLKKFNDEIFHHKKANAINIIYGKIFTYSYVGIIQIGNKRIEILPKLFNSLKNNSKSKDNGEDQRNLKSTARKNLFHLLSFIGLIPIYKSGFSRYGQEKDLFEFFISLFLTDIESIFASHLHHEYIPQSDELGAIKGKLDFQKQALKLPSQLHTFSCDYDEFSIDNPLNRIIKATLKRIQELSRNEDNKKRAFHFYSLMNEIQDDIITPTYISKLHFTRLNEKFEKVIEFCSMILFGSTYTSEVGKNFYYALIFDMNLVFEKFVVKLLRNTLTDYTFICQSSLYLVNEHEPALKYNRTEKRMIPDILVKNKKGDSVAIIDTKYKLDLLNGFVSNADTYQMLAYSVAYESDKSILLYPQLPNPKVIKERNQMIVLDKLVSERKSDRSVMVSACSVDLFDENGKILHKLSPKDAKNIMEILTS